MSPRPSSSLPYSIPDQALSKVGQVRVAQLLECFYLIMNATFNSYFLFSALPLLFRPQTQSRILPFTKTNMNIDEARTGEGPIEPASPARAPISWRTSHVGLIKQMRRRTTVRITRHGVALF